MCMFIGRLSNSRLDNLHIMFIGYGPSNSRRNGTYPLMGHVPYPPRRRNIPIRNVH